MTGNPPQRQEWEMSPRFDGMTAIVTGGGRGVGRAIAVRLAHAGAAVALASRSGEEIEEVAALIEQSGGRAIAIPADVTQQRSVDDLVSKVARTFGPPSLLVNNAGSWRHVGPVAECDPEEWWTDMEVNVKGTLLCTRAVLPAMLAARAGRIVNVSSYAGISASPYLTAYASAKAAVLRLTDSLDAELDGSGVRAFAISPGFVRTALVQRVAESDVGMRFLPHLRERADAVPPERAAELVVEIASGRLDALAGRFLHVLDDVDELVARSAEIAQSDLYVLRLRVASPDSGRA
jgi:NAD(P)-dependent dehydrogenase (short-subunit alcohol dehydrogenase family)